MTMTEYYDRQIPEYYPTMYLDGYTPEEIMHAASRKMYNDYLVRKEEAAQEVYIPTINFKTTVKIK